MTWKNTDPRLNINKRADIVILRPGLQGQHIAGTGYVDTKDGWHICTSFDDYKHISADDKWDPIWQWIHGPEK